MVRSGVLLFLLTTALVSFACDRVQRRIAPGDEVVLDSGSVRLPDGGRLREVRLEAPGGAGRFTPDTLTARPGDAVRFTAGDAVTHAVRFDTAAMPPAARRFLADSRQVASPPLLARGSAWVVSLQDAPPGRYPFHCMAHGASGTLTVAVDDRPR